MAPLHCGCAKIRDAEKIRDPEAARLEREMGREQALQWRCPFVCKELPKEIPPEAVDSIKEIEATTRTTGLRTCPSWYTSQPWARHVAELRAFARDYRFGEDVATMTSALYFAIKEVDAGKIERDADDDEKREQRRKRDG